MATLEIETLRQQLTQAREDAETLRSRYENATVAMDRARDERDALRAIARDREVEIQELRKALAGATPVAAEERRAFDRYVVAGLSVKGTGGACAAEDAIACIEARRAFFAPPGSPSDE